MENEYMAIGGRPVMLAFSIKDLRAGRQKVVTRIIDLDAADRSVLGRKGELWDVIEYFHEEADTALEEIWGDHKNENG